MFLSNKKKVKSLDIIFLIDLFLNAKKRHKKIDTI